ncbi:hypothetical protein Javan268_0008 [Streptococcus phage Javan268]|nr:hypothetical protein Javan268_0008 [Streptococcus phage Javan268]
MQLAILTWIIYVAPLVAVQCVQFFLLCFDNLVFVNHDFSPVDNSVIPFFYLD